MSFILFILSLCIFTKIPFKYKFVSCLNLISTQKNGNILFKNQKYVNKIESNDTSHNKCTFGRKQCMFIHTTLDSIPFKTHNSCNIRSIGTKQHKISKSYHNLRLKSHAKIPHIKPDDTYDEINEYDMKRINHGEGPVLDDIEYDYDEYPYPIEDEKMARESTNIPYDEEDPDTESDVLITSPPWKPADDVGPWYLLNRNDLKLSFDRWPENSFLRIKIFSYYKHLASLAAERVKLALKNNPNLKATNPMSLPMRRKRWCYMSAAFVDKRSKDLIEVQEHVRIVDIIPNDHPRTKRLRGLLMIPIPELVSFDYWFEEIHKPVKSKYIHDLYRDRRWVSKYFLYHRDKHKKKELIDKLTSPELIDEIPLKWKKQFKEDYYFYQLGELKKLYKMIVTRKAEDEARKFYNVKMPEIFDFGEIRFIGNREDRQYDPDYSSLDRID